MMRHDIEYKFGVCYSTSCLTHEVEVYASYQVWYYEPCSRGSAAQLKAMEHVCGSFKIELTQYCEVAIFAPFGLEFEMV